MLDVVRVDANIVFPVAFVNDNVEPIILEAVIFIEKRVEIFIVDAVNELAFVVFTVNVEKYPLEANNCDIYIVLPYKVEKMIISPLILLPIILEPDIACALIILEGDELIRVEYFKLYTLIVDALHVLLTINEFRVNVLPYPDK